MKVNGKNYPIYYVMENYIIYIYMFHRLSHIYVPNHRHQIAMKLPSHHPLQQSASDTWDPARSRDLDIAGTSILHLAAENPTGPLGNWDVLEIWMETMMIIGLLGYTSFSNPTVGYLVKTCQNDSSRSKLWFLNTKIAGSCGCLSPNQPMVLATSGASTSLRTLGRPSIMYWVYSLTSHSQYLCLWETHHDEQNCHSENQNPFFMDPRRIRTIRLEDFVLEIGLSWAVLDSRAQPAFESIPTLPPRHCSAMASELMASHGFVLQWITDVDFFSAPSIQFHSHSTCSTCDRLLLNHQFGLVSLSQPSWIASLLLISSHIQAHFFWA